MPLEIPPIVTLEAANQDVLRKKTADFSPEELPYANQCAEQLRQALSPYQPAAGLAATQIGLDRSIFIYSYDRNPAHLETVINPSYEPIGDATVTGWEGCLSVILGNGTWRLAKVPRYEKIRVSYINETGQRVQKDLTGFSAKVFQHECDHLQGTLNIDRKDAEVKAFNTKEDMDHFLRDVKKDDATRYTQPS